MYFLLILKWLEVRFLQEQMLIIHGKYENKAISTFSFVHWITEFFSLALTGCMEIKLITLVLI